MIKTDIIIIGGSAAGFVAATTAKTNNPTLNVTIIREEEKVLVPCGIPYIFGSLENSNQNIIPDDKITNIGVDIIVDKIISVDIKNKTCKTKSGKQISFNKIIFTTGSTPKIPNWLKGADLENVFTVPKDKVYIDKVHEKLSNFDKIIVIGGGFIGVEISDELNKKGKDVTLVEVLPHILGSVFDDDTALKTEDTLIQRGVKVKSGSGIKKITGDKKVTGVVLDNGNTIEAQAVVLSMGYVPNTDLANDSGIKLNKFGQIIVDEHMRTENPNVFAAGDCAQKRDFITSKITPVMLASIACNEGKIAGKNLFNLSPIKSFKDTIAIFSTAIGKSVFGVAGYTKNMAKKENLDIISAKFEIFDKHPAKLPNTQMQSVELIVIKKSGLIIGGTVTGGISAGEIVNSLGIVIQNKMTVYDLDSMQIGTHPLLTASPIAHPLVKAGQIAISKL